MFRMKPKNQCSEITLPVGEVNPSNPTVRMYLNSQCFYVVCSVCAPGKVSQVELDLVPAVVESHGHRADEWLHSGGGLRKKNV